MTKIMKIEGQVITITTEGSNVRIKNAENNVILIDQTMANTECMIANNFNVVYKHYLSQVTDHPQFKFYLSDIAAISLKIVLYYLYLYNMWRINYKKSSYDLNFKKEDFYNSSTYDLIIQFYKKLNSPDWKERVSVLTGMSLDELLLWYQKREQFYNK